LIPRVFCPSRARMQVCFVLVPQPHVHQLDQALVERIRAVLRKPRVVVDDVAESVGVAFRKKTRVVDSVKLRQSSAQDSYAGSTASGASRFLLCTCGTSTASASASASASAAPLGFQRLRLLPPALPVPLFLSLPSLLLGPAVGCICFRAGLPLSLRHCVGPRRSGSTEDPKSGPSLYQAYTAPGEVQVGFRRRGPIRQHSKASACA
jgi:hypothetical protein